MPHLECAVESALKQTFTDFELIVIDDGSTDRSEQVITRFLDDPRVTYFRNPVRLGLFANYNECMKRSRAPLIKLFAQDDVLAPEALSRMKKVLDSDPDVALVSVAKRWINVDGSEVIAANRHEVMITRPFENDAKIDGKHTIREALYCGINWLGEPSTMMFRRESIGEGFDVTFSQLGDLEFWFRILETGDYFFICDRLCDFRQHGSSATSACTPISVLFDFMLLGDKYADVLAQKDESVTHYYKRMLNWTCGRYARDIPTSVIEELWQRAFDQRKPADFEQNIATESDLCESDEYKGNKYKTLEHLEEMQRRMAVAGMIRVSELLANTNLEHEAELEEKVAQLRYELEKTRSTLERERKMLLQPLQFIKRVILSPLRIVQRLRRAVF